MNIYPAEGRVWRLYEHCHTPEGANFQQHILGDTGTTQNFHVIHTLCGLNSTNVGYPAVGRLCARLAVIIYPTILMITPQPTPLLTQTQKQQTIYSYKDFSRENPHSLSSHFPLPLSPIRFTYPFPFASFPSTFYLLRFLGFCHLPLHIKLNPLFAMYFELLLGCGFAI